jgi:Flp pilus assembly protein TadD
MAANEGDSHPTQSVVGIDPIPQVHVFENHDKAYHIWRQSGVKRALLVHIDAHHDMWWRDPDDHQTIANFICSALAEDLAREVWWVVPDQTWESPLSQRPLLEHLARITRKYPGANRRVETKPECISTTVLDKPLRIYPLRYLPPVPEEVLLDIDTDFLVIPRVSFGKFDDHSEVPWCWPDELIGKLSALNLRTRLVTIAYSVEGGYTPLKWKYLGDEIANRIRHPADTSSVASQMQCLRLGAEALLRKDHTKAEQHYLKAVELNPQDPASHLQLAILYSKTNRLPEARDQYRRAIEIDPSYRTPYNNLGIILLHQGRHEEARAEFEATLALNPSDAYALLGLAKLAIQNQQWNEASTLLNRSISTDGQLVDAHRELGAVLARQGSTQEAIQAYETSLKLALSGQLSLAGHIMSCVDEPTVSDPGHGGIHIELAKLYESIGKRREAIDGYRMGIAGKSDGTGIRLRLVRSYLAERLWSNAILEMGRALGAIPGTIGDAWKKRPKK